MKPRISIAMLLAAMVPIAVGFAALANPTAFWEGSIFLLTMVVMFAAVLGACYRRKAERAFWLGFSLFGWGLFLVSSDLNYFIRPTSDMWYSFGTAGEHSQMPFPAFVRNLVDTLQLNRSTYPRSIGEKVQVQWGSGASYYPSTVSDIKDGQYKIRYDSDSQGRWDEWVGMNRIKSDGLARCYRIAEMLFMLLFAIAGAMIGVYFFATGRPREPGDSKE
jgi:hypothetical protein